MLKGGYAMELRFQRARATRDLDFTVRAKPVGDDDAVLAILQEVGAADAGDWFTFRVSEATTDLDGAPYGGARYPVEAMMSGRTFVKFHLDVGIGDVIVDPVDTFQAVSRLPAHSSSKANSSSPKRFTPTLCRGQERRIAEYVISST